MKRSGLTPGIREEVKYENPYLPIMEFIDQYDTFPKNGFPSHWHPELEFHLILRGSVQYQINGNSYHLDGGSAIYIAPEAIHSARSLTPGTVAYNVLANPQILSSLFESIHCDHYLTPLRSGQPDAALFLPQEKNHMRIIERLIELYNSDPGDTGYEIFLLESLLELWRRFSTILQKTKGSAVVDNVNRLREKRLRSMIDFIRDHYSEEITVQDIAASTNISKSECFRCFSMLEGTSPIEYLSHYRLLQAAQELSTTDRSISDICYAVGFNNTSWFSREFKRLYGMTPTKYRASTGTN
ncbi:MAG: AraC family transcriptional regulator [Anaerovoracaceae bacterium]|jgi:AraC-like DNA-binding protein/mannose-6-phosphate isomerase-like protein (cupin superfamily)